MSWLANNWAPVVIAALAALGVSVLGALATDLSGWYYALEKPAWQPPEWLFGPAWTTIFALTAIAGVLAWNAAGSTETRQNLLIFFLANATLNVVWSLFFFRLKRPDWALAEVVLLWLSIVVLIVACGRLRTLAGWLLTPYLAWVTFAAALNFEIVRLNGPFQKV